jgi:hypothetical protein
LTILYLDCVIRPSSTSVASMRVFAIWIEHALDVAVKRAHNANPGKHRWPVLFNH